MKIFTNAVRTRNFYRVNYKMRGSSVSFSLAYSSGKLQRISIVWLVYHNLRKRDLNVFPVESNLYAFPEFSGYLPLL